MITYILNCNFEFFNQFFMEGHIIYKEPINIKIIILQIENFNNNYNFLEKGFYFLSSFMEVHSHMGKVETKIIWPFDPFRIKNIYASFVNSNFIPYIKSYYHYRQSMGFGWSPYSYNLKFPFYNFISYSYLMPLIGITIYSLFSFISYFICFINNIPNYIILINKYLKNVYKVFLFSTYKGFKENIFISTLKKGNIDIITYITDYLNSLLINGDPSDRKVLWLISWLWLILEYFVLKLLGLLNYMRYLFFKAFNRLREALQSSYNKSRRIIDKIKSKILWNKVSKYIINAWNNINKVKDFKNIINKTLYKINGRFKKSIRIPFFLQNKPNIGELNLRLYPVQLQTNLDNLLRNSSNLLTRLPDIITALSYYMEAIQDRAGLNTRLYIDTPYNLDGRRLFHFIRLYARSLIDLQKKTKIFISSHRDLLHNLNIIQRLSSNPDITTIEDYLQELKKLLWNNMVYSSNYTSDIIRAVRSCEDLINIIKNINEYHNNIIGHPDYIGKWNLNRNFMFLCFGSLFITDLANESMDMNTLSVIHEILTNVVLIRNLTIQDLEVGLSTNRESLRNMSISNSRLREVRIGIIQDLEEKLDKQHIRLDEENALLLLLDEYFNNR